MYHLILMEDNRVAHTEPLPHRARNLGLTLTSGAVRAELSHPPCNHIGFLSRSSGNCGGNGQMMYCVGTRLQTDGESCGKCKAGGRYKGESG